MGGGWEVRRGESAPPHLASKHRVLQHSFARKGACSSSFCDPTTCHCGVIAVFLLPRFLLSAAMFCQSCAKQQHLKADAKHQ